MQRATYRRPILILGTALAAAMLVRVLPVIVRFAPAQIGLAQIARAQSKPAQTQNSSASHKPIAALSPYIDVHPHLDESDPEGSMQSAIHAAPEENLAKIVFMPSPFTLADANRFDLERLLPAAKKFPGKIAVLGGGGTLNPLI